MPQNCTLNMVKMINFMSCVFYYNYVRKKGKERVVYGGGERGAKPPHDGKSRILRRSRVTPLGPPITYCVTQDELLGIFESFYLQLHS